MTRDKILVDELVTHSLQCEKTAQLVVFVYHFVSRRLDLG
jgi:hypothetical protein